MTGNPWLMSQDAMPGSTGVYLDGATDVPMFASPVGIEALAQAQWRFDPTLPAMPDLVTGASLLPIGVPPVVNRGFVTVGPATGALGSALVAPIPDAAEQTLVCAFQHNQDTVSRFIIPGGWIGGQDGGQVFWWQGGGFEDYLVTTANTPTAIPMPPGAVTGSWLLVAITSTAAGPGIVMFDGQPPVTLAATKTPAASGGPGPARDVCFGGVIRAGDYPGTGAVNLASPTIFPVALTPFQLKGVFARLKALLAQDGIAAL